MFDHTYKLNLRTHNSPINSDNRGSTVISFISPTALTISFGFRLRQELVHDNHCIEKVSGGDGEL